MQRAESAKGESVLDFNSKSGLSDRINHLIDAGTVSDNQDRKYLGASIVGHHCERHVQYHLMAARGMVARKTFPPRILRIFDRGNLYEERCRAWLLQAGFVFGRGSSQKGFKDFGDQFAGHVDGILTGWRHPGESIIPLPALWENKCLGAKGWKKVKEDHLKAYSSTYYAQVQIYMHYMKLKWCLFTAVNADTMEIYHELVPFDVSEAMLCRSRVQQVITATNEGRMVERCTNDKNFYICKWCDFREICWSAP